MYVKSIRKRSLFKDLPSSYLPQAKCPPSALQRAFYEVNQRPLNKIVPQIRGH